MREYQKEFIKGLAFFIGGLLLAGFFLLLAFKQVKAVQPKPGAVLESYEPITLNNKYLATKGEYDIEKKVVAGKVRNFDRNNVDWNELQSLSDDWEKVRSREKCEVDTTNVKLPEDGWKLIQLTAAAIQNGTCK